MRILVVATVAGVLIGCSSGSSNSSDDDGSPLRFKQECTIEMDTLSLASGESCFLNQTSADVYSLTAGEVSCDNQTLSFDGGDFFSGSGGVVFNGLTFICAAG